MILLFILIGAAIIAYGIYAAVKRRKEMHAWATRHGMRFRPGKDKSVDDRYPNFKCFHRGHSRYGKNFISGEYKGRGFLAFDYHYTTGSGKNQSHHSFTAVILTLGLPMKPLSIRPEGFFDKVTEFFGYDDIDFESAEFSRRFYVRAPEKRWAYDVLHTRTMAYLLSVEPHNIEFDGVWALAHRGSRVLKTHELEQAADILCEIVDQLPDYVVAQQGGRR
ncbi:MAG: hypothetical protein KGY81_03440 [Phycisphaerae bacterium]|nr:hypothetical protein [Phycisphaerae bacterium]